MRILLYIVDALFALMALGIFMSFTQTKRIGLLLGALCFGLAAYFSYSLVSRPVGRHSVRLTPGRRPTTRSPAMPV